MNDRKRTIKTEYDAFSMQVKFNLKRFGGTSGKLSFIEKSFFNTIFGF